jgi:hypothetical protein
VRFEDVSLTPVLLGGLGHLKNPNDLITNGIRNFAASSRVPQAKYVIERTPLSNKKEGLQDISSSTVVLKRLNGGTTFLYPQQFVLTSPTS